MGKTTKIFILTAVVLAISVGSYFLISKNKTPGELDNFTLCLKDKGAVFYGAFWCPHCQNQKTMFGKSAKLVPYIECSTPDGRAQTSVCQEKEIKGYPTWEFADGTRETGEVSLETLSQKTGCPL